MAESAKRSESRARRRGGAHGGARKGAGRKPAPETLLKVQVYLYPRHMEKLKQLDKNYSRALRAVIDAAEEKLQGQASRA